VKSNGRRGGTFCDVGANIGYFSLIWLAASPKNTAILVEPDPRLVEMAKDNLVANGFEHRADIHTCAAGASRGEHGFVASKEDVTGWGRLGRSDDAKVQVFPLDELLGDATDRISMLKIDVEGAEPLVLRGAAKALKNCTLRSVLVERNIPGSRELGLDPNESFQILESAGFKMEPLDTPGKPISNWYGKRD